MPSKNWKAFGGPLNGIPSPQAVGTDVHRIIEQAINELTEAHNVEKVRLYNMWREKVQALVTREEQLRGVIEELKRQNKLATEARDLAQRRGVTTANYWLERFEELRDRHENYKRDVLARAYGGIPWVKDLGIFDTIRKQATS